MYLSSIAAVQDKRQPTGSQAWLVVAAVLEGTMCQQQHAGHGVNVCKAGESWGLSRGPLPVQDCARRMRNSLPPQLISESQAAAFREAPGGDRPLEPLEERRLIGPLTKLRQACCHPQVLLTLCLAS